MSWTWAAITLWQLWFIRSITVSLDHWINPLKYCALFYCCYFFFLRSPRGATLSTCPPHPSAPRLTRGRWACVESYSRGCSLLVLIPGRLVLKVRLMGVMTVRGRRCLRSIPVEKKGWLMEHGGDWNSTQRSTKVKWMIRGSAEGHGRGGEGGAPHLYLSPSGLYTATHLWVFTKFHLLKVLFLMLFLAASVTSPVVLKVHQWSPPHLPWGCTVR